MWLRVARARVRLVLVCWLQHTIRQSTFSVRKRIYTYIYVCKDAANVYTKIYIYIYIDIDIIYIYIYIMRDQKGDDEGARDRCLTRGTPLAFT